MFFRRMGTATFNGQCGSALVNYRVSIGLLGRVGNEGRAGNAGRLGKEGRDGTSGTNGRGVYSTTLLVP